MTWTEVWAQFDAMAFAEIRKHGWEPVRQKAGACVASKRNCDELSADTAGSLLDKVVTFEKRSQAAKSKTGGGA